jgi:hypothetical protein
MAAILNERRHWSLKGTFLQSPPISQKKIGPVNTGIRQIIDGNQFQDGGRGGQIENQNTQIFERNLLQLTPTRTLKINMLFTECLPQHSQNPTRTNRSSGLIRNSYLLNKQMIIDNTNSCLGLANKQDERFTPFLLIKSLVL